MSSKGRPTLGLVMIVRDEEEFLPRALASVVGIVDEVIIVDTGSSDNTKEVAASFADKVPGVATGDLATRNDSAANRPAGTGSGSASGLRLLDFTWKDDFSAARNFGLEHASADWILQLDADEELGAGKDLLPDLLRDKYVWGYYTKVIAAADIASAGSATESTLALRLFRRRPDLHYRFPIHEQVTIVEEGRGKLATDLVIVHFGPTAESPEEMERRRVRNITMLRKAILEHPSEAYFYHKLGSEYLAQRNYQNAYAVLSRGIKVLGVKAAPFAPTMLRNLAWCLSHTGHRQESLALLEQVEERFPDYTDLFFLEGKLRAEAGEIDLAIACFSHCLRTGEAPPHYSSWNGAGTWRAQANLAKAVLQKRKGALR